MIAEPTQADVPAAGWRLKLGVVLFGLSIAIPVLGVPLVAAMGVSAGTMATLSGLLLGGSEVLGIVAVAVMGKSGYAYIKNRVFGFIKRYGPPAEVSRIRYRTGLVMFALPVLFGWAVSYAGGMIPGYIGNEFAYVVGGDLLLLASLFVLGGDFWDKLRALFIHGARAVYRETND